MYEENAENGWTDGEPDRHRVMTLELDLLYIKKSRVKFQLNMSKHIGKKCRKLGISSILSSKRGITPTKINAN